MRAIKDGDLRWIYSLFQDQDRLHLWAPESEFDHFKHFRRKLALRLEHRWRHARVFQRADGALFGFAYCYHASEMNRHACVCVVIGQAHYAKRYSLQALYRYFDYLFDEKQYNKLYAEVYAYNTRCMRLLRHLEFIQEGCLSQHQWWREQYWDQYIYMITQSKFNRLKNRFSKLIGRLERHAAD